MKGKHLCWGPDLITRRVEVQETFTNCKLRCKLPSLLLLAQAPNTQVLSERAKIVAYLIGWDGAYYPDYKLELFPVWLFWEYLALTLVFSFLRISTFFERAPDFYAQRRFQPEAFK